MSLYLAVAGASIGAQLDIPELVVSWPSLRTDLCVAPFDWD